MGSSAGSFIGVRDTIGDPVVPAGACLGQRLDDGVRLFWCRRFRHGPHSLKERAT